MLSRVAVVLCLTCIAGAAQGAETPVDPISTGGTIAWMGVGGGVTLGAAQVRLSRRLTPWLALEAEAGTGIGSRGARLEDADGELQSGRASLDYQAAAYVVASAPVASRTDLLLRLGYGVTAVRFQPRKPEDEPPPEARSRTRATWAASLGVQHFVREDLGLRLDYTRQARRALGGKGGDVWAVGLVGRF